MFWYLPHASNLHWTVLCSTWKVQNVWKVQCRVSFWLPRVSGVNQQCHVRHNVHDCSLSIVNAQFTWLSAQFARTTTVCRSVCLSVCLSVCMCLCVYVCLCVSIHLTVSSIYPLSYSTSVCLCCVNPATSVPVSPKLNFETSEKRTLMQKTSVHRKHKYKLWNAKRTHWDWTQKYCPFAKQPSVVLFYANSAPAHMIYQNVVNLELFHLKHIWCIFSSVLCKAAAAAVAAAVAAAQLGTLSL